MANYLKLTTGDYLLQTDKISRLLLQNDIKSVKSILRESEIVSFLQTIQITSFNVDKIMTSFVKAKQTISFAMPLIDKGFPREDTHG